MTEDQQDRLELALFAEQTGDEKYKGLAQRYADYFKAHDDLVKKLEQEDPDVDFEDNGEYQAFIKGNQPTLTAREVKVLERQQVLTEAEDRAFNRMKEKFDAQEKEIRQIKNEPQAKEMVAGVQTEAE